MHADRGHVRNRYVPVSRLPPGTYNLEFTVAGFTTLKRETIPQ